MTLNKHRRFSKQNSFRLKLSKKELRFFIGFVELKKAMFSTLLKRLRDLHDRYMNRPPREEDLETIEQLKKALQEKEDLLRKIHVILFLIFLSFIRLLDSCLKTNQICKGWKEVFSNGIGKQREQFQQDV